MNSVVAAVLAFSAFGFLLAGTVFILLLNPRSPGVRWWVAFQLLNLAWLGTQGWAFAADRWPELGWIVSGTAHLMPAVFLAFALVEGARRPGRYAALIVALGVATLPIDARSVGREFAELFLVTWHLVLWSAGTWLLVRGRSREPWPPEVSRRLGHTVVALLVVVAPLSMVGGFLLGMRMWFYAMPVLVVWIQLLIFVGIARLRFYDIEVRLRRTGELAAEAAEQERFAVLGELAASLAHEIRNPLTGVRSLAQRIAEEPIDDARRQRYASVILEEVGRVERLVTNLLGVARRPGREAGTGLTPLQVLFDDLLLLVDAKATRAGVTLRADADRLVAAVPRELLAQALLNLLLNAVGHTPRGGTVELLARRDGEAVRVMVRDDGPGVPAELRERIWQPFFSGGTGTGLGLAVVRRLAREQGWEAGVDEAPGGGAEFRLRVPAERPAHVAPPEPGRALEVR